MTSEKTNRLGHGKISTALIIEGLATKKQEMDTGSGVKGLSGARIGLGVNADTECEHVGDNERRFTTSLPVDSMRQPLLKQLKEHNPIGRRWRHSDISMANGAVMP